MIERFFKNVGAVFILNSLAIGAGLLRNILLARHVSEKELGLYSLLFTLIGFLYPLSLFGQQVVLVRLLYGERATRYNIVRGLIQILTFSAVFVVAGALIASWIYALAPLPLAFVIVFAFCSAATDLVPVILRTRGIYNFSIFILRGVNFFLLAGFVFLAFKQNLSLQSALLASIIIPLLFTVVVTIGAGKHFSKGPEKFPSSIWKDGLLVSGATLSLLVIILIDQFLIPKLMSLEALGLYFAISAVMRVFELVLQSAEFVLLPYASGLNKNQILKISAGAVLLGAILVGAYWIAGPWLVSFLYGGAYDHGIYLIPYFSAVGFLRFIYVIPFSIISGKLSSRRLRQLTYANLASMILAILCGFVFISKWGLVGAALNGIVVWCLRVASGFGIMYLEKLSPSSGRSYAEVAPSGEPSPPG